MVSCGTAHRDLGPPFLGLPNTSAAQSGAHVLKSPQVQTVKIGGQREKDTVQVDERDPTPPPTHTHTTQNKSDQRAPHAAAAATTMPISGDRGETLPAVGKKERKPFEATDTDQKTNIVAILNPNPSLQHIHTQMGFNQRLDGRPKVAKWRFTP